MATFNDFYTTTLAEGALPFDWEDPVTDQSVAFRFGAATPTFRIKLGGPPAARVWQGTLELEMLPEPSIFVPYFIATHEAGNLAEWGDGTGPSGGGFFNDGVATVTTSTAQARFGARSMQMTINTTAGVDTAVRAFRWKEAHTGQDLYYSGWYYFPQHHVPTVFWNVMQFKSELYNASGAQIENDPIFTVNVDDDGVGGALHLHVFYFGTAFGGSNVKFTQAVADLPVGQWVHIEAFLHQAENASGILQLWQDGNLLIELTGRQTKYVNGYNTWSINNYSNGLTPATATIYVDDAVIAITRQGPELPLPVPPMFTAILASLSSIVAAFRRRRRLAASLASQAQISAALDVAGEVSFSAALASVSSVAAGIRRRRRLVVALASQSQISAGLTTAAEITFSATLASMVAITAAVRRNRRLAAVATSQSTLAAQLSIQGVSEFLVAGFYPQYSGADVTHAQIPWAKPESALLFLGFPADRVPGVRQYYQ